MHVALDDPERPRQQIGVLAPVAKTDAIGFVRQQVEHLVDDVSHRTPPFCQ